MSRFDFTFHKVSTILMVAMVESEISHETRQQGSFYFIFSKIMSVIWSDKAFEVRQVELETV